jgi:hypothetical protein
LGADEQLMIRPAGKKINGEQFEYRDPSPQMAVSE